MSDPASSPKKIPRQPMPEQPAATRVTNFNEVTLGYTSELALAEASRCLQCKKPLCVQGCPVGINIPGFIAMIARGDTEGAAHKLHEYTSLPAICGRVCPQESQCEKECVLGRKGEPIAIGRLERFAADAQLADGHHEAPPIVAPSGRKVAVIGAGPAGLTVAGELLKRGHAVTLFEAFHEPGGVLVYGIPEFRLPKKIVHYEIETLTRMGAEIRVNVAIGRTFTVDELMEEEGFDAVFIGTGAGLPVLLDIPGEHLNGIYSCNEFLLRVNLMRARDFPKAHTPVFIGKSVAVIGGGNTAMDAARVARRLGTGKVSIVYRRTEEEMPARAEEVHHGKEEGIEFLMLTAPVRFLDRGDGWLQGMECVRMQLGEPDESGRRRPVPVEGSHFVLETDTVIIAAGNNPNQLIPQTTPDLQVSRRGTLVADERGATTRPGVFAGGDAVTGAATVILAMGAGKKAAEAMDEYLRKLA